MLGSPKDWLPFSQTLTEIFGECSSLNLWHFLEKKPLSLLEAGHAIAHTIAHQDPHPMLLGYSMGGRLALHALRACPGVNWKGAILLSTHTGLTQHKEKLARITRDTAWAQKAHTLPWELFIREWNAQDVFSKKQALAPLYPRHKLQPYAPAIAQSLVAWSLGKQEAFCSKDFARMPPTLWLAGEEDERFVNIAQQASRSQTCFTFKKVKQAGHRLAWQAPDSFLTLCAQWKEATF